LSEYYVYEILQNLENFDLCKWNIVIPEQTLDGEIWFGFAFDTLDMKTYDRYSFFIEHTFESNNTEKSDEYIKCIENCDQCADLHIEYSEVVFSKCENIGGLYISYYSKQDFGVGSVYLFTIDSKRRITQIIAKYEIWVS
jgi:hypothetical protein